MRLVILSNRLPVTITEKEGSVEIVPSSGGLVTALGSFFASLKEMDYLWIGWPGGSNYSQPEEIQKVLLEKYHSWPLFLEEKTMDLFYNGFCNKVLWPLFHYFPRLISFDEILWDNYREVNRMFAEEVLKKYQPGDVLWIHDYHLMLAPGFIREKLPDAPIGFFLHIPFPSYEIFRLLPRHWGKEILNGLLQADLAGFHTDDYTRYFFRCVLRILGINHNLGMLALEHKLTRAGTFPMGIDYNRFHDAVNLESVRKEKAELKRELRDVKTIFSVDRQDYTKGIINRLEGFESFLKSYPEWRQKVVLIMIIIPSRIGLEDYQNAKNMINQLVGKINGDYGNVQWTPVIYQYKAISFEHLIALYNISDVGLVTPLRDGMNLVAKEFVAARTDKKGVLILSEMAGAAMELGEAVIINPNHRQELAEAIKKALEIPAEEQARRINIMQDWLKKNDVKKWAFSFLEELQKVHGEQEKYGCRLLDEPAGARLLEQFRAAKRKIIFLDYDGTLVPFSKNPSDAVPGRKLVRLLKWLSGTPGVDLVLISGRDKKDLQSWYGKYSFTLVAEHGAWIKKPGEGWKVSRRLDHSWKPHIRQILENYRGRLPRSFLEEKDYSISWHYRTSDESVAGLRVKEFVDHMIQFTAPNNIELLTGNKVVEIKCSGISKGETATRLIAGNHFDFIMGAGDDETDESLFRAMPEGSYTIKIGKQKSYANYYLDTSADLLAVLEKMIDYKHGFFRNFINFLREKK